MTTASATLARAQERAEISLAAGSRSALPRHAPAPAALPFAQRHRDLADRLVVAAVRRESDGLPRADRSRPARRAAPRASSSGGTRRGSGAGRRPASPARSSARAALGGDRPRAAADDGLAAPRRSASSAGTTPFRSWSNRSRKPNQRRSVSRRSRSNSSRSAANRSESRRSISVSSSRRRSSASESAMLALSGQCDGRKALSGQLSADGDPRRRGGCDRSSSKATVCRESPND